MKKITILSFLTFFFFSSANHAALIDLNFGLTTKSLSTTYDSKISYSNNALAFYANLGRSEASSGVMLGWNFSSLSHKENISGFIDQTVTSTDTGPAFRIYKQRDYLMFSLGLAYGIVCKGKYVTSTVDEEISGESYMLKATMETRLGEKFWLGFSLNMFNANYKISVVNSVQSDVSYKNTWTYPAFSLGYQF
jgi:hypothetical protein